MRLSLLVVTSLSLGIAGCSKSAPKETPAEPKDVVPVAEAPELPPEPVTYDLTQEQMSQIYDSPLQTLSGEATTLSSMRGKPILVVNVASECGLTPQYEQLQAIQAEYEAQGFHVVGFPSNQFGQQEPGTPEEILAFGKENFGVTFPLMEKVDTNGPNRHPVYQALTQIKDATGEAGDVQWNFEKFLLSADGKRVTRFRPKTLPTDPQLTTILKKDL
jgi:glutathione peroxidase